MRSVLAAGAGLRAGVRVPVLPPTSLAPLVAALLGLDFEAVDAELCVGLIDD